MLLFRLNFPLLYVLSGFYSSVESKTVRVKNTLIIMLAMLSKKPMRVMLADDDREDREIFISAVQQVAPDIHVSVATDGRDLMATLLKADALPDILFLDLNMPLKNGQECLPEIRSNERLKDLPVIIYSTSSNREYIDQTYTGGANYYLPKPDSFKDLKLITEKIFSFDWDKEFKPQKEKFVLTFKHFQ